MRKLVSVLMAIMFFMVGCAAMNPHNLKSPYARANFVNNTYISIWNDYNKIASLENLKPEVKPVLEAKRILIVNLKLPISLLNGFAESGTMSDAMYNELLNRLLDLETGWYTNQSVRSDELIRKAIEEGGIVSETSTQVNPVFIGVLIELLKTGLHAWNAILKQAGYDEAQMQVAWGESRARFNALNISDLVVVK